MLLFIDQLFTASSKEKIKLWQLRLKLQKEEIYVLRFIDVARVDLMRSKFC